MLRAIPAVLMYFREEYCSILCKTLSRFIIFSDFLGRFLARSVDAFSATLSLLQSKLFSLFS